MVDCFAGYVWIGLAVWICAEGIAIIRCSEARLFVKLTLRVEEEPAKGQKQC